MENNARTVLIAAHQREKQAGNAQAQAERQENAGAMNRLHIVLLTLLSLRGWAALAQVAKNANREYLTPQARGRAAKEMDHPNRKLVEQSPRLVASLGIRPGEVVADIGTGVGYLLPYLAEAVGPHGRVIAEDIYEDFLSKAQEKIRANGWTNVITVRGTAKNPKLPFGGVDLALILDTYHHIDYPAEMLGHIRKALKPDGRLILVDFYRSRKHPGTTDKKLKEHIRADRDEVIREIQRNGFHLTRQFDHLPHEYVLIFRK